MYNQNSAAGAGNNDGGYHQQHHHTSRSRNRQRHPPFPYEEPTDSGNSVYSCDPHCGYECRSQRNRCSCQCDNCDQYSQRRCASEDGNSCYCESVKSDFLTLAYQKNGDYPELVDELENTLSQRNRERVQKTMERFEMYSRQNKNLDKPIFDDEESVHSFR